MKKVSPQNSEGVERKLTILLAEDNDLNVKVLSALLKSFPYELVHAENGEIALAMLGSRAFDMVLMDIQMPVLDGVSATQSLRNRSRLNQHVPVIAMTANAMSGDRESYLEAGMTDYVPKPIDARRLYAAIAHATSQGRASGPAPVAQRNSGVA